MWFEACGSSINTVELGFCGIYSCRFIIFEVLSLSINRTGFCGIFFSLHITLGIKIAQKPYIVWSLGPKALIYESLDS